MSQASRAFKRRWELETRKGHPARRLSVHKFRAIVFKQAIRPRYLRWLYEKLNMRKSGAGFKDFSSFTEMK